MTRRSIGPRRRDGSGTIVFFFTDSAPTEIYTLSLHDALPISQRGDRAAFMALLRFYDRSVYRVVYARSEEHTSELQSRRDLVCRLLLEKKNQTTSRPALARGLHGPARSLRPAPLQTSQPAPVC